jgi:hypothetical protein
MEQNGEESLLTRISFLVLSTSGTGDGRSKYVVQALPEGSNGVSKGAEDTSFLTNRVATRGKQIRREEPAHGAAQARLLAVV